MMLTNYSLSNSLTSSLETLSRDRQDNFTSLILHGEWRCNLWRAETVRAKAVREWYWLDNHVECGVYGLLLRLGKW